MHESLVSPGYLRARGKHVAERLQYLRLREFHEARRARLNAEREALPEPEPAPEPVRRVGRPPKLDANGNRINRRKRRGR